MTYDQYTLQTKRIRYIVLGIIGVVILGVVLAFSFQVVPVGHMGVMTHWGAMYLDSEGKPVEMALQPRAYIVVPFQDIIVPVSIQVQEYTVSSSAGSNDLQSVTTQITLNWHLTSNTVTDVYQELGLGYKDTIITPALHETLKQVTAKYTAGDLIKKRPEVKSEMEELLRNRMAEYNIIVDAVSITDFSFSPQFQQAIDNKVTAEENAKTETNKIAIEQAIAQQKVATAQGAKQSAILQAEGEAQSTLIKAKAEAEKIRLINEFLAQNPEYIEWVRVNTWNGHLPDTLILGQDGAGTFLQIPGKTIKSEEP